MSVRITERALYSPISDILRKYGVSSVQEVSIRGEGFPDLLAEIDGHRFLIEVKINAESKMLEDVASAYVKAMKINAQGVISMLFPSRVRDIPPTSLESVARMLEVSRVIVASPWGGYFWKEILLEDFVKRLIESYKIYHETKRPLTSYDLVVNVSREAVVDIASAIRHNLISQYVNDAMAIVGRFDLYRATLKEFKIKEEEMKAWIADIIAYLTANQLLFYHILSQKRGYRPLPDVNPFMPDQDLINKIRETFCKVADDFYPIFGPVLLQSITPAPDERAPASWTSTHLLS